MKRLERRACPSCSGHGDCECCQGRGIAGFGGILCWECSGRRVCAKCRGDGMVTIEIEEEEEVDETIKAPAS